MATVEIFILYEPVGVGADEVDGFVMVARSALEEGFGSMARFLAEFPDLKVEASNYRDAGDDQVRVLGGQGDLVAALWHERFGAAARVLAEHLMRKKAMHWKGHSYLLADHVLGRV
jgi:hypothetical protein